MSEKAGTRMTPVDGRQRPEGVAAVEARDRVSERLSRRAEVAGLVDELRAEIRAILTLMEADDTL